MSVKKNLAFVIIFLFRQCNRAKGRHDIDFYKRSGGDISKYAAVYVM